MSDYLFVHQPLELEPAAVEPRFQRACGRLSEACDSGQTAMVIARHDYRLWSARTSTMTSASFRVLSDERSWIAVYGSVSVDGKRVSEQSLRALLADISRDSCSAARRLDGVYTVVAWDAMRSRLFVIPDALGFHAAFVRTTQDGLIGISSSILALADLDRITLDPFTFRAMFRCGHRLPPHTIFNEVRSIPEGSLAQLDSSGLHLHSFWRPEFRGPVPSTLEDCAQAIGRQIVASCDALIEPGSRVFSDLTGGYDSRVTTAAVARAGISFIATVAGSDTHPDVIAAKRICEAEGLTLAVVDPKPDAAHVMADVAAAIRLSEGSVDAFAFASTLRVKRKLFHRYPGYQDGAPMTVSGALGECYRDFYWSQEFFDRGKRQRVSIERLMRYRMDASPAGMECFATDWREDWRRDLSDYIAGIVDDYPGERNTSQIDAVYLRKMAGMIGSFACAASRISAPLAPFGSLPALDIALSVPPEWRFDARLLRQIAWWLSPGLASHMTLSGRPCAPMNRGNWRQFLPKYVLDAQRVARKFSTVWLGRTWFPEYQEPVPAVNPYAAFVEAEQAPGGYLDLESMHTAHCYDPSVVRSLLRTAVEPGGAAVSPLLSKIYTCEAMLRAASCPVVLPLPVRSGAAAR